MGPMPLHLLMTVAVDGCDRWNETAKSVEHSLNVIATTIASMNFDSAPNAILDSMLNVCSLLDVDTKF